jgi:hypothetical protein
MAKSMEIKANGKTGLLLRAEANAKTVLEKQRDVAVHANLAHARILRNAVYQGSR